MGHLLPIAESGGKIPLSAHFFIPKKRVPRSGHPCIKVCLRHFIYYNCGWMADDRLVKEIREALTNEGIELFGFALLPSKKELESILNPSYLDSLPRSISFLKKPAWRDPRAYLPWAKSAVCVALPYNTSREPSTDYTSKGRAWISRYAWGEDYHFVLRNKLKPLKSLLLRSGYKARIAVDSFPLLEKRLAARAGLGFIGKNGLLINSELGSYLFLGEVITDAELPASQPVESLCGGCVKCVSACPSRALNKGGVGPSLCVSSYNVEWNGALPDGCPPLQGRLFGCDLCQEACPFNKEAPLAEDPSFKPKVGLFAPDLMSFRESDDKTIEALVKKTPLERRGAEGLRNSADIISREHQTKRDETELSS